MMTDETSNDNSDVAKVEVDNLLPHLTCPICNGLYAECTTIADCLHKFCKQCIFDKFTREYRTHCPVCDLYLGVNPLLKLRKDNSMDSIRTKLFPKFESKKPMVDINLPKNEQIVGKEKTLSSLVDNLPKAPTHDKTTKKRSSKPRSRKTTPVQLLIAKEPTQKVDPKQPTSSNASSSKNVLPKDKQQTNEKDNEQVKKPLPRILCDLNMMPDIVDEEDDEPPGESALSMVYNDTTMAMPFLLKRNDNFEYKGKDKAIFDEGTRAMPFLLKKNDNFEYKGKDKAIIDEGTKAITPSKKNINFVFKAKGGRDKTSIEEISSDKSSRTMQQLEKKKEDKTMEEILPTKVDLNTPLTSHSMADSTSTNPFKIVNNASSHLNKNKNYNTPKGKGIDNDNDNDNDNNNDNKCSSFGWFNKEQPNFQLNKNNTNVASSELKTRGRRMKKIAQVEEDDDQLPLRKLSSSKNTPKRRQRKLKNSAQLATPQQEVAPPPQNDEEKVTVVDKRPQELAMMNPIWFTLLASKDPEAGAPLPQVPCKHLRVKDIHMPVSFVMMYIARKLHIDDYNEIEVLLRGQRVMPSMRLCSLREVWCQNAKTLPDASKVRYKESAEEFMMVLTYALKYPYP